MARDVGFALIFYQKYQSGDPDGFDKYKIRMDAARERYKKHIDELEHVFINVQAIKGIIVS